MLKLAFKNRIRHNLIRCIVLLLLSLIGVCVVAAGISFPSTARDTVNSYLNETNFWDVHVGSTLGFNAEDVSAVSAVSGVTKVMPVLSTKTSVSVNNSGNYKAYIATTDFKTLSLSSSGFISFEERILSTFCRFSIMSPSSFPASGSCRTSPSSLFIF